MNKYIIGLTALVAIGANAQVVGDKGQINFGAQEIRAAVYDCVRDQKFDELVPDVEGVIDCKVLVVYPAPAAKVAPAPALGATDK